jgi:hypothetical protein
MQALREEGCAVNAVEDLAGWLTAVWDEEERQFEAACEAEAEYLRHDGLPDETAASVREFWLSPEAGMEWPLRLARIAADRKILALHSAEPRPRLTRSRVKPYPSERLVPVCAECSGMDDPYIDQVEWPCTTLLLLASPYADRPGFRPEWLVERQGVEQ